MSADIDIARRESEAYERIREFKRDLADSLVILGHHYQRSRIIELSDHIGDSYALAAKAAASPKAEHIVFCGVEFMAESAEVLSAAHQTVYHPNADAGCPMADMAAIADVEAAYDAASVKAAGKIIPLAYMNSSVEVKAFCGRHGGLVCTSSNAGAAMEWAYRHGKVVMFVPDEHLATNTADTMEIPAEARTIYDPEQPGGGDDFHVDAATRLIQWKGHCHVHTLFTVEHVEAVRRELPGALVVVHPECPREVTQLADVVGSTSKIVNTVADAPEGATIIVGTEINLVERLAVEQAGKKRVRPLQRSFCPNMYKINLKNLSETLSSLDDDRFVVTVPPDDVRDARTALQRMLEVA